MHIMGPMMKRTTKIMLYMMFLLTLMIITSCASNNSEIDNTPVPQAVNGIIDLTQTKVEKPIPLDGEWAFYWNQLVSPDQIELNSPDTYVHVPSPWNKYELPNEEIQQFGFATYVLEIRKDWNISDLALYIPEISSAYTIWVNGTLLKQNGIVSSSEEEMLIHKETQVILINSDADELEIVIQVSNYTHMSEGIVESIRIGSYDALFNIQFKKSLYDMFLAGTLFIMSIYHIAIYLMRRLDRTPIFFAAFCFVTSLRSILSGETIIYRIIPSITSEMSTKLEYLSLALGVMAFGYFLYHLYPREASEKVLKSVVILCTGYLSIIIFAPLQFSMSLLSYFQLVILLSMLYCMYIFILAAVHKRDGGGISLFGAAILTIMIFNDILYNQGYIHTGFYVPLGLFIFIIAHSFILGMSSSKAFASSKELAARLQTLNNSLEDKVKERTRKLEEVNLFLKKQTLIDGLTGIANRRQFDVISQQMLSDAKKYQTSFTLLLIDIDYFKNYNDTYGHQAGDDCLIKVAEALNDEAEKGNGLVARYGGEEFVLILSADANEAKELAEKIVLRILSLEIPHSASMAASFVTISCGMATCTPNLEDEFMLETLIQSADEALYRAKQAGRNRYC